MPHLMTDQELEAIELTRDIGNEILQGIDDMLANNATQRTVISETEVTFARKSVGLTKVEFAKLLGISTHALEFWEQGCCKPSGSAKTLIQLCIQYPLIMNTLISKNEVEN